MLREFAYEEVTVSSTSKELTAATYQPTTGQGAKQARILVTGGNINVRSDGTAPTSTVGTPYKAGNLIVLESQAEIVDFRAIKSGALDAVLRVSYLRNV